MTEPYDWTEDDDLTPAELEARVSALPRATVLSSPAAANRGGHSEQVTWPPRPAPVGTHREPVSA